MISPTEALVLSLLVGRQHAYASELVNASGGKLKRGSVYTTLSRLEDAGFVKSSEEPATDRLALPRTVYRITAEGKAARHEFGCWTGILQGA